jgi:hypothetical protein
MSAPIPQKLELHLSKDSYLPKRFGKRIRALGGTYSSVRGNKHMRFVHLPNDDPGRLLANQLIKQFAMGLRNTVVLRGITHPRPDLRESCLPAWVVCHQASPKDDSPLAAVFAEYEKKWVEAERRHLI